MFLSEVKDTFKNTLNCTILCCRTDDDLILMCINKNITDHKNINKLHKILNKYESDINFKFRKSHGFYWYKLTEANLLKLMLLVKLEG